MDLLDRLLGHDAWTTRQILLRCQELDPSALHQVFHVGHGTLYETLTHMIGNVRIWTDLMTGTPIVRTEGAWDGLSVDDLIARHDAAYGDFAALVRRIRDDNRFDELWIDTLDNPPTAKSYGGAIGHVITHNMHHRSELLQMLGRLGLTDLLEGDLPEVHTRTVAFGIRHVLCAPLRLVRYVDRADAPPASENIGVLYLDSRERGRLLSPATAVAIEALATEAATAIENARLYREAVEKAKLDRELQTASKIQQALLPEPRRTGPFYEAVGASVPSRMIGGDFFDYLDMAEGAFGFALGDVTGKGPSAALVTAVVQGILGSHVGTAIGPADLVALVNRVLLSRRIESRFATIFLGTITPAGMLTYCNAAQNPPFLFSAQGAERLETGGTLVGAFTDAVYEQGTRQLAPGDTLVMFSDGVVEALSAAGEEFSDDRVRGAVNPVQPPERILDALLRDVHAFTHGAPQSDDLTAVVVRYLG